MDIKYSRFLEIKQKLIDSANKINYTDLANDFESYTNLKELTDKLKKSFMFMYETKILNRDLIEEYREEFATNDIYLNKSIIYGFVIFDDSVDTPLEVGGKAIAIVCKNLHLDAYGEARVYSLDNAIVRAHNDSVILAYDKSNVTAYDRSSVQGFGESKITAFEQSNINLLHNSSVTAHDYSKVTVSSDGVVILNETTIAHIFNKACQIYVNDNAYCIILNKTTEDFKCNLYDNAICSDIITDTIYYANEDTVFKNKKNINNENRD